MEDQPSNPPRSRRKVGKAPKKASAQTSHQDEIARQRGRPRLETKDQTAAERRRTQIRLAQRAYRQRKETTISGLSKRVSSLEQTIEDMHKAFTGFHDEALAAGLVAWNPTLANSLQRSAATFAELAKNGIHQSDGEEDESPTAQHDDHFEEAVGDILSSRDFRPELPKHESDPGQRRRPPGADAGLGTNTIWGYSPTFDEGSFMAPSVQQRPQNTIQRAEDVQMQNWDASNEDFSTDQTLQLYQVSVPEPSFHPNPPGFTNPQPFWNMNSIPNELPLPKTFSFTETSFARRLLRHSLEAAIQLLSSPHSRKEDLDRFCRFTFCYSNRPTALNCIKAMIKQSAYSNLEFWHVPIYHLGGAGLHYPRVGIDATSNPPDNWAESGPIGPTFNPTPETPRFSGVELERIVKELGVDGEWFDANDVEQYLRTRGVFLNGQSSLVEINEPDDESNVPDLGTGANTAYTANSPSNTHSSLNGPQSPQYEFTPTNAVIYGNEDLFNTDPLSYDDVVPDIDVNQILTRSINDHFSGAKNPNPPELDMNAFPEPSFGEGQNQLQLQSQIHPAIQQQTSYFNLRRKKYVDVDKLINKITPQSVCLGRTPGFRREAIDNALRDSTTEAMAEMVMA